MKHIIGFPGLFKDRFVIDRVAFDLGKLFGSDEPMYVYWYGLIIVTAMIVAYVYFMIRAKKTEGIVEDHSMNLALFALPIGIIGARTFYVLTNLDRFESLKEAVLGIRDGGLAIYGGLVFGLLTILVYCYIKKLNCFRVLDAAVPAVMIAQAIGRWGNFFNAEAYGSSEGVKSFFLRMTIANLETPNAIKTVHPTFLYESMWNVLGFIIANILYRKKKFNGQILCLYLFWYGIGRGFIELLRTDSCMIFGGLIESDPLDFFETASGNGLKAFVYLSIILVISSFVLFFVLKNKSKNEDDEISELKIALAEGEIEKTEENVSEESEISEISEQSEKTEDSVESESVPEADNEGGSDDYEDGEDGNDGYDE